MEALRLTIDNLFKIIKELHPLYYDSDKEWHTKGYSIAKNMISKYNNTIEANIFAMRYYITGFNDTHMALFFHMEDYLSSPTFPGFLTFYNPDNKTLEILGTKDIITHINNKPFIEYFKEFLLYNNGKISDESTYTEQSYHLFFNYNNPFLPSPKTITIKNKLIPLKYKTIDYKIENNLRKLYFDKFSKYNENEHNIYKKDNIIYITIGNFYKINFDKLKALLPAKQIVVDLRNNRGGGIDYVSIFFKIVYNINYFLDFHSKPSMFNNIEPVSLGHKDNIHTKANYPKLKILINSHSLSASGIFVNLAQKLVNNVEIIGETDLSKKLCGTSIYIAYNGYELTIPTHCNQLY